MRRFHTPALLSHTEELLKLSHEAACLIFGVTRIGRFVVDNDSISSTSLGGLPRIKGGFCRQLFPQLLFLFVYMEWDLNGHGDVKIAALSRAYWQAFAANAQLMSLLGADGDFNGNGAFQRLDRYGRTQHRFPRR